MPIILLCGLPASYKTYRSQQLLSQFQTHFPDLPVTYLTVQSLHLTRAHFHHSERLLTQHLLSAIERHLSSHTLLLVDFPNDLKSIRYQIHCLLKNTPTTQCVLHCDVGLEQARENYENRQLPQGEEDYEEEVFNRLCQRWEPPRKENRWDQTLFSVLTPELDPEVPFEAMCAVLFPKKLNKTQPHLPQRSQQDATMQWTRIMMQVHEQLCSPSSASAEAWQCHLRECMETWSSKSMTRRLLQNGDWPSLSRAYQSYIESTWITKTQSSLE